MCLHLGIQVGNQIHSSYPFLKRMFHLDQAMTLLPGKVALVTSIADTKSSEQNASEYQYYVNGIPFIHAETGQHTYYMPVFASSDRPLNKSNMERTVERETVGFSFDIIVQKYHGVWSHAK